jgi:hypothetical protein
VRRVRTACNVLLCQPRAKPKAMPNAQTLESQAVSASRWEAPCVEVISLSCEITAYAPDGEPLF